MEKAGISSSADESHVRTTLAMAASVGLLKVSVTVTSNPCSRQADTIFMAANESPPSTKKLSFAPMMPSSSFKIEDQTCRKRNSRSLRSRDSVGGADA